MNPKENGSARDQRVLRLYEQLAEIERRLIPTGLHVFGRAAELAEKADLLRMLRRSTGLSTVRAPYLNSWRKPWASIATTRSLTKLRQLKPETWSTASWRKQFESFAKAARTPRPVG